MQNSKGNAIYKGVTQWRIRRVFDSGICPNNEKQLKKNLINSNLKGIKSSIKAIKTVFVLCFNQFLLPILNCVFFAFYTSLLILMFPHCVKSVQIRSFFWSIFSRIRTEYGEIRNISPYVFGHISHSAYRPKEHSSVFKRLSENVFL